MQTKSYKLTEETINELENISKELDLTWEGTFTTLANMYHQQQAVVISPERKGDVEHFQTLLNQISEAFTHSLNVNVETKNTVKQEYDKRIARLEEALTLAEDKATELTNQLECANQKIEDLTVANNEQEELIVKLTEENTKYKDDKKNMKLIFDRLSKLEAAIKKE